jgi:hypothetical protein
MGLRREQNRETRRRDEHKNSDKPRLPAHKNPFFHADAIMARFGKTTISP